jgi:exodeoxyribonuclease V alpha subunit
MEDAVVARLANLARQGPSRRLRDALEAIGANFESLSEEQARAVRKALSAGFTCLRGGAGTGKTHVARAICRIWEAAGGNLLLAAVAGKAALRLSRSTGRLARTVARTLHQLDERARTLDELAEDPDPDEREKLGARLRELAHADENTLAVIDEASILDLSSLHGLLRRLPDGARLLLIGDECQLPPVNFGLLFHRFVRDPNITATLQSVHRQSSASGIPEVAALIRQREIPKLAPYGTSVHGVLLQPAEGRDDIADKVIATRNRLAGHSEVMIVTPVNDGPCGVAGLNRRLHDDYVERTELQELPGPLGDLFSPGEPVVHRRNDYRRGLFNGSIGRVRRIDRSQRSLTAVFDDEEHVFRGDELVDLALGYALTCHRAQGSEARNVIVALPSSRLLDPSWLYTAVTRASELAVLVGQEKTIQEALGRPSAEDRRLVGLHWPPTVH